MMEPARDTLKEGSSTIGYSRTTWRNSSTFDQSLYMYKETHNDMDLCKFLHTQTLALLAIVRGTAV